jgi:hypothetical protein
MTIVVLSKDSAAKFSIFIEKAWRLNWELFADQALVDFEMLDGDCVGVGLIPTCREHTLPD